MDRLYIIKYKIYEAQGGSFKYATNPKYEERILVYKKEDRDEWIKKYLSLTSPEKELYIEDVVCYYTDTFNKIKDMNAVINAV